MMQSHISLKVICHIERTSKASDDTEDWQVILQKKKEGISITFPTKCRNKFFQDAVK